MTEAELEAYINSARAIILVSNGKDGYPHPMPMFFGRGADGAIEMATYRTSQKVRNLERDPRVTLLVESGSVYEELKGAVLYCKTELVDDADRVFEFMAARAGGELKGSALEMTQHQSRKRVLLRFQVERAVTWDHTKLGGVY